MQREPMEVEAGRVTLRAKQKSAVFAVMQIARGSV